MLKEVRHKYNYYKMSNRIIVKGTSPREDKPLAIYGNKTSEGFPCYSIEEGYFIMSCEERGRMRKFPRSAKYTLIGPNKKDPAFNILPLSEQCKILTERGPRLKDLTDGKLNIFRTGSVAKTALQLFYDLCDPDIPPEIKPFEVNIIQKCRGALQYGKKYKGIGYKYDVCSEYPSLLMSAQHRYPVGEGELKTITNDEFNKLEFFSFGIYHVKVRKTNGFIFRNNFENWYTHTDLNYAKKMKYEMELVEDESPNCLLYSKDKLKSGKELFGKFISYLFDFKEKGHKEIKPYLNGLWGALTQSNKMKVTGRVHSNKEVLTMMPMGDDINFTSVQMEVVNKDVIFETTFARIKPFIMSYGRVKTANIIMNNLDNVVRVHTDGFILTKPINKEQKLGNGLGDLKYEGRSWCEVKNNSHYVWLTDRIELVKSWKLE